MLTSCYLLKQNTFSLTNSFYHEAPVHYVTVKIIFQFDYSSLIWIYTYSVITVKVSAVVSKGKWRTRNIFNMPALSYLLCVWTDLIIWSVPNNKIFKKKIFC